MKKLLAFILVFAFAGTVQAGVRCTTDAWGNTTCYGTGDNSGYSSRTTTDAWGNTNTTDNRGNRVRCTTDAWGNVTCN